MEKKGAIGHIGGRFFDICGKELDTSLAERMIGIDFGKLKGEQEPIPTPSGLKVDLAHRNKRIYFFSRQVIIKKVLSGKEAAETPSADRTNNSDCLIGSGLSQKT